MKIIKVHGKKVEVDDLGLHYIIKKDGTKSLPFPNLTRIADCLLGAAQ